MFAFASQDVVSRVWVSGFGSQVLHLRFWVFQFQSKYVGLWVWGSGCGFLGLGVWVWVSGFGSQGLVAWVWISRFGSLGFGFRICITWISYAHMHKISLSVQEVAKQFSRLIFFFTSWLLASATAYLVIPRTLLKQSSIHVEFTTVTSMQTLSPLCSINE